MSFAGADNTLQSKQTLPSSFLDDIRQACPFPDENHSQVIDSRMTTTGLICAAIAFSLNSRC
ncbi:hypothetical protein, partial [Steroidobacter sp.]|uniref:hypothetical protein n=1 Tax=Steroidobacter sp. TaxID=1978227 RepID=UPI0025F3E3D1